MRASRENFPLLDELLAEQQRLDTPVARFSAAHDAVGDDHVAARSSPLLPQLIPLSRPNPGEQYAFEVDLDSCTGCKSCVAACHSLNGLEDTETWRDVGLLVSTDRRHPFTQTITTACHHCADPACLNGCPVLAYEKDPITGIVRHLDDQCIGCSYCILKCPYDVPKFSARLGIVRKCDMCHDRLAHGEAPACAQACPTHAIRIVTVESKVSAQFLAAAPAADYTQPTTRYVSTRPLPASVAAADAATLRAQPAHWPLVFMLTLMPGAIAFSVVAAARNFGAAGNARAAAITAVVLGALGLGASVFHLGQPRRAWRIFLGWRKSWLSREALAFAAWLALAVTTIAFPPLAAVTAGVGIAGLACSVMIYVDTRREFWRLSQTAPRFFGTLLLVIAAVLVPRAAGLGVLLKLAWETNGFFAGSISMRLQRGPLRRTTALRDVLGIIAAAALYLPIGWLGLALLMASELAERHLFFRAVDAPKMPGLPTR